MNPWDQFTGANAGYVQELYERYQQDPESVDEATRAAFAAWAPPVEAGLEHRRPASVAPRGTDARAATGGLHSSPNRSAGSAIWPRASIRWASTRRSANRR